MLSSAHRLLDACAAPSEGQWLLAVVSGSESDRRLVEATGLKGYAIGGARISPVHANFIEAGPDARATDVIALMDEARRRVRDAGGPVLHAEVRYLHPEWGIGQPPLAEVT